MRTKRWTSDCGEKWYELREDGTVHTYKGSKLKIYKGKGTGFTTFSIVIDGKFQRVYIPMKRKVVEYFVDNPKNYRYVKQVDEDESNYHHTNLLPVKTFLESLSKESRETILANRNACKVATAEREKALKEKIASGKTAKAILSRVGREVDYQGKIEKGKLPPSSVATREARTKEKFRGYMPRVGLFGKTLLKEEPKYDHNFKLR